MTKKNPQKIKIYQKLLSAHFRNTWENGLQLSLDSAVGPKLIFFYYKYCEFYAHGQINACDDSIDLIDSISYQKEIKVLCVS